MESSIIFGAREWLWVALVLAVAGGWLAVWSYWSRSYLFQLRFLAMLLKVTALVALAFCLLEPMQRLERPQPGANVIAVMVDNSRSMEMRPPGDARSRVDRIRSHLPTKTGWQARLSQDFDLRRYAFDDRVRAVTDLSELRFDGTNSSLVDSLETLQSRFAARHVAGALIFTDGLATDDLQAFVQRADFSFPIYPIVDHGGAALQDIALRDSSVVMSSFELAPASVEATVTSVGLDGRDIVVRLIDQAGKTLEKETISGEGERFERRVRFQFLPSEPGFQLVTMRAMLASEDSDEATVRSRVEATTANNSALLAINRGGGPYRVLYVSGRPNWEFKFVRRALEEDVELVFHGLLRIAKKEPKFSFRDRGVETSNPLMAGFSDDEETIEQYDEPVLVRIGEGSAEALKAGFPSSQEDLFAYHAIILDDVEASFFSQPQMLLIREFVAQRGGGLMMLGGQESFLGGGYRDTPLGDVLPVYLRGREDATDKSLPVRYRLTRQGGLEPWLRLRPNEADERKRVEQMPDFLTWNRVAEIKPGASILAQIDTDEHEMPGLVSQRFGKGRSLALLVGDFWRWSMRRPAEDDDLAQSWRQIARWLTSDVPRAVEVQIEPPTEAMQPHRIQVQVRDESFKPLDNASIALVVTEPDGQEVSAVAIPDAARPGLYVAEYWSSSDGGYRCRVETTTPDGQALEAVHTGWTAQPSAREFARLEAPANLLSKLAEKSGGEVVPLAALDSFVTSLPTRKVPVTETRLEPLWHRPWLILMALTCLCAEWGLRRWKGLP